MPTSHNPVVRQKPFIDESRTGLERKLIPCGFQVQILASAIIFFSPSSPVVLLGFQSPVFSLRFSVSPPPQEAIVKVVSTSKIDLVGKI